MTGTKAFIDSNVLVYLLSSDALKADVAEATLRTGGTISVQVLNEVANVCRRKLGLPWAEIDAFLAPLRTLCTVEPITLETHNLACEIAGRYQLGLYDAMIVSSALLARCTVLYSEDMHAGLVVENQLRLVNPFNERATK